MKIVYIFTQSSNHSVLSLEETLRGTFSAWQLWQAATNISHIAQKNFNPKIIIFIYLKAGRCDRLTVFPSLTPLTFSCKSGG